MSGTPVVLDLAELIEATDSMGDYIAFLERWHGRLVGEDRLYVEGKLKAAATASTKLLRAFHAESLPTVLKPAVLRVSSAQRGAEQWERDLAKAAADYFEQKVAPESESELSYSWGK